MLRVVTVLSVLLNQYLVSSRQYRHLLVGCFVAMYTLCCSPGGLAEVFEAEDWEVAFSPGYLVNRYRPDLRQRYFVVAGEDKHIRPLDLSESRWRSNGLCVEGEESSCKMSLLGGRNISNTYSYFRVILVWRTIHDIYEILSPHSISIPCTCNCHWNTALCLLCNSAYCCVLFPT